MGLKACKECSEKISSDASTCPRCGKKSPHGMSSLVKYGGGFLAVMFGLPLLAGMCAGATEVSRGRTASAAETAPVHQEAPVPTVRVSAATLFAEYEANEVAADNVYKGRLFAVSGNIDSIRKDFMDDVVIVLKAGGPFNGVHATMASSESARAASASKGVLATVVCKGGGAVLGSPVLRDCTFEN